MHIAQPLYTTQHTAQDLRVNKAKMLSCVKRLGQGIVREIDEKTLKWCSIRNFGADLVQEHKVRGIV